ncbi:hypothetical protein ACFSKS_27030 [Pseudocitrobacter faecalis]
MKYDWILFDADETLFHFDAFKGMQLMFAQRRRLYGTRLSPLPTSQ